MSAIHGCLALLWLLSSGANAHLMSSQKGTINVQNQKAYVVVNVPVAVFAEVDWDGNGLIDAHELKQNEQSIRTQFEKGLRLVLGKNNTTPAPWSEVFLSLANNDLGHGDNPASSELIIMAIAALNPSANAAATPLTVDFSLWRPAVSVFTKNDERISFSFTVSEGASPAPAQIGTLTPARPRHRFEPAASITAPAAAPSQTKGWLLEGVQHIVGGYDHLLFLFTLLATGVVLRRWLILLSTFTLAHGVIFGLLALGRITLPPSALIEPLILLSIVTIALAGLWRIRLPLRLEMLVVFGLGLIHGMGFSFALSDMENFAEPPILGIVAFNGGIELGQIALAAVAWWLIRLARLGVVSLSKVAGNAAVWSNRLQAIDWVRVVCAVALLLALYWLVVLHY